MLVPLKQRVKISNDLIFISHNDLHKFIKITQINSDYLSALNEGLNVIKFDDRRKNAASKMDRTKEFFREEINKL